MARHATAVEEAGAQPLDPARVERLERLGVRWDIRARGTGAWDEYFGALKRYKGPGNGDPNCVKAYVDPETGLKLGMWQQTASVEEADAQPARSRARRASGTSGHVVESSSRTCAAKMRVLRLVARVCASSAGEAASRRGA